MSLELISLIGGNVTGFVTRLIASQIESQQRMLEAQVKKQEVADASADAAAKRGGGVWVRRIIACSILFAVIVAPFILALIDIPVAVEKETMVGFFSFLINKVQYEQVTGFILLPEVRQGMLALLGFYFGSSMVKR